VKAASPWKPALCDTSLSHKHCRAKRRPVAKGFTLKDLASFGGGSSSVLIVTSLSHNL